jgi:hypothetical protein
MTEAEFVAWEALCDDLALQQTQMEAARQEAAAAKASAEAKLAALGLTADEIKALVG